jgi:BirA family biotin operon repressor/biotin-[acetyl-CoA-carboxylase] ligase
MYNRLIQTLADGEFHSGQSLGDLLGVSRTAVWKHLRKLESYGLVLESVKGLGYRIPGGLELLDPDAINSAVDAAVKSKLKRLELLPEIDSTNSYIAALGDQAHGVVCVAERQTGGRGRRGKTWVSPYGKNIYMSLGWSFEGGAAALEGLSLAVGIAVRRALNADQAVKLKWPNDILFDNRKLAGILLEMTGDPSGVCHLVIGIGVNVGMIGESQPAIDQPWADAKEVCPYSRNEIVARTLSHTLPILEDFSRGGFALYLDEWHRHDACMGKPVTLITPALSVEGIAVGVAANGAIRIDSGGVVKEYSGGEISLRLSK